MFAAAVDQIRRDARATREHADAAIALAREQDFRLLLAWASAFAGWASVEQGRGEEGLSQILHAISETRTTGTEGFLSHLHALLAEAHLRCGRLDAGLAGIDEALGIVQRTGDRSCEAELYRLRGELLLATGAGGSVQEAERAFAQAISVGRSQGARLLVLRAAMSSARLWVRLGRGEEARDRVNSASRELGEPLASSDAAEAEALLGDYWRMDRRPPAEPA